MSNNNILCEVCHICINDLGCFQCSSCLAQFSRLDAKKLLIRWDRQEEGIKKYKELLKIKSLVRRKKKLKPTIIYYDGIRGQIIRMFFEDSTLRYKEYNNITGAIYGEYYEYKK